MLGGQQNGVVVPKMADWDRISSPLELEKLVNSLDLSFPLAIQESSLVCLSRTPPTPLGLEIFLFALYHFYPSAVLEYYGDSIGFERLGKAIWSDRTQRFAEQRRKLASHYTAPPEYVDSVPAFVLEVEPDLERVLLNAVRIGRALGHERASIVDLVASIATEAAILESLKAKWGITLKRGF